MTFCWKKGKRKNRDRNFGHKLPNAKGIAVNVFGLHLEELDASGSSFFMMKTHATKIRFFSSQSTFPLKIIVVWYNNYMKKEKIKDLLETLGTLVAITATIFVARLFVTPVRVSGHSMDNTLKDGMFGLCVNLRDDTQIERGDIVIVKEEGHLIVKRVIGMPNETIECIDGKIVIDGLSYDEEYTSSPTEDFEQVKIGDDEYFVMGDNRSHSKDSRYYGPVDRSMIKAKDLYTWKGLVKE